MYKLPDKPRLKRMGIILFSVRGYSLIKRPFKVKPSKRNRYGGIKKFRYVNFYRAYKFSRR